VGGGKSATRQRESDIFRNNAIEIGPAEQRKRERRNEAKAHPQVAEMTG